MIMPDGVNKSAILVNNQFPGPTIEANWGDTFEIPVSNMLQDPDEGTLIHWHGLRQQGTPWNDGVPSVDLCPIPPSSSFTYKFLADQYGTSWWHSHYSAQLADGLWGPMIIYGPSSENYEEDLGPISLSSHYHKPYTYYLESVLGVPPGVRYSDNNLINGKMFYNCSLLSGDEMCEPNAPISTFMFKPNATYLLRLINSGAEGTQHFSIDDHDLTVIANDFTPLHHYRAKFVTLAVGQRTDVLVMANGNSNTSYWMRANISQVCDPANQPNAVAAIYYPGATNGSTPASQPAEYNVDTCTNGPLPSTVPIYPIEPPSTAATTAVINITLASNSLGKQLFYMNNISYRGDYDMPILLSAQSGNDSYKTDPELNVYDFGTNTSIRLVINNFTPLYHPMHVHGHNFYVLAEGQGNWNGNITNPMNPQRRDVQILPIGTGTEPGFIILHIDADNPGIWSMHCHITWHLATGLYINILERPEDIMKLKIPTAVPRLCREWWDYNKQEDIPQPDSGS